jgi:hypothetical protein
MRVNGIAVAEFLAQQFAKIDVAREGPTDQRLKRSQALGCSWDSRRQQRLLEYEVINHKPTYDRRSFRNKKVRILLNGLNDGVA